MTDLSARLMLLLALVCSAVGLVDAGIGRQWDLLVIFALTTALLAGIWLRQRVHRVSISLRPDLAHWIEHRAEAAGEPFDDVLDRAVATFRHGIVVDERSG